MTELQCFLREAASAPHRFGEWDCLMMLANWVRRRLGTDPASALRGAYSDDAGWRRLVADAGGMVDLVDRVAVATGLRRGVPRTGVTAPGDIAVVGLRQVGLAGALVTDSGGYALKLDRGLIVLRSAPLLASWTF